MPKQIRPTPWYNIPFIKHNKKKAIIIGAGISGASTAYSLATKGFEVYVYEKNSDAGKEASGNYQGILYGSFSAHQSPSQELSIIGYEYSQKISRKLLTPELEYNSCGIYELSHTPQLYKDHQLLANSIHYKNEFIEEIFQPNINLRTNISINCNHAIYYPDGIWVKPQILVKRLLNHPKINLICHQNITELKQTDNNLWQIFDDNANVIDESNIIILCNSHYIDKFEQTKMLPIRKIRGQISIIPGDIGLNHIVCCGSYITPSIDGYFTCGATFKFNDTDTTIRYTENIENIKNVSKYIPQLSKHVDMIGFDNILGQANIRASTNDYLPLVGPVAKFDEFINTYKPLSLDSNYWIESQCEYYTGLYINVAHGSKGILTAPICGEIIANQIINPNDLIVSKTLQNAIHPNRLWTRQIIKRQFT